MYQTNIKLEEENGKLKELLAASNEKWKLLEKQRIKEVAKSFENEFLLKDVTKKYENLKLRISSMEEKRKPSSYFIEFCKNQQKAQSILYSEDVLKTDIKSLKSYQKIKQEISMGNKLQKQIENLSLETKSGYNSNQNVNKNLKEINLFQKRKILKYANQT